jgi:hypothetical protein
LLASLPARVVGDAYDTVVAPAVEDPFAGGHGVAGWVSVRTPVCAGWGAGASQAVVRADRRLTLALVWGAVERLGVASISWQEIDLGRGVVAESFEPATDRSWWDGHGRSPDAAVFARSHSESLHLRHRLETRDSAGVGRVALPRAFGPDGGGDISGDLVTLLRRDE